MNSDPTNEGKLEEEGVGDDVLAEEGEPESDPGDGGKRTRQQSALYGLIGLLLVTGIVLIVIGMTAGGRSNTSATPFAIPSVSAFPQTDPELASVLTQLQAIYVREGEAKAREFAESSNLIDPSGRIYLTLDLDTEDTAAQDDLVRQLEALGVKIDNRFSKSLDVSFTLEQLGKALEIPTVGVGTPIALPTSISPDNLPPTLLQKLADLKHVSRVRIPREPSLPYVPAVPLLVQTPEGVQLVRADEWQRQGFTGKGLKIGIIDVGGFLGYEAMLGEELPTRDKVHVKAFNRSGNIEGNPGVDEFDRVHGTACAEIIHAMAPDAELYFAAFDSNEETAIKWLESQGVSIISASYGGHYYPSDGKTNPALRLINQTHDRGIFWALSAGNEGKDHYKGRFKQGSDGLNIFYNGSNALGFTASRAGSVTITLRWDDWEASTVDYNLYLLDKNLKRIATSEDIQQGPPTESVEFMRFNLPSDGQYYITVGGKQGVKAVDFDIFTRGAIELEKSIASGSIGSPGDAAGALTVGAVHWDENTIASYSSQGPTDDGRVKPEISAPAGVTSRSYGRLGSAFYGTSASAPFVAGAAALVLSANPNMKPDEVRDFLLQHAKDLGDTGVDNTYGYGLLDMGTGPNAAPTGTPEPPTQEAIVTEQPPTQVAPTEPAPTAIPVVPTPRRQPTAAPIPPNTTTDSGGGVLWMAVVGGSMVGVSLIIGLILLLAGRRKKSTPPPGYSWPPPQGGPYPQQPRPQQYPPGYYPGPGAPPQAPPGNWPPPQSQPQYQQGQYRQPPPGYPIPPPGQPGYPSQYPQPQQPAPPGYGPQGQPVPPGQGRPPQSGYPPPPGYGGQQGQPPPPGYRPPAPVPPSYPQPQPPGAPPQRSAQPPQPQGGYQMPSQQPQQPQQPTGPGGRPMPPPPKGAALCPNCGRMLKPGAGQCDNCGWRKP